jgi:hypothetical protein
MENLSRPLAQQSFDLETLEDLLRRSREPQSGEDQQVARDFLMLFCRRWNENARSQDRPSFVAFYGELQEDVEADDWPHRVRNRLGLAHYGPPASRPRIPVALMKYPVHEILDAAGGAPSFAWPTVLDGPLNSHFFPAPGAGLTFGRTLALEPDPECESLVAELLHRRMDYRPEHLYRVGFVDRPIPPHQRGPAFAELRNAHLFCLRYESGREDFGAEIPLDRDDE